MFVIHCLGLIIILAYLRPLRAPPKVSQYIDWYW